MAYKGIFFTGNALGAKDTGDVICSFNISGAGSLNLRVYATTAENADNAVKLQHSPDGVTWIDVGNASTETTSKSHTIKVSEAGTTTLVPLYPLGRVIAAADSISISSIGIFMDR